MLDLFRFICVIVISPLLVAYRLIEAPDFDHRQNPTALARSFGTGEKLGVEPLLLLIKRS